MPTSDGDDYPSPLQHLNRVERLVVGWSVLRQFRTNTPRFAKWVHSSGPRATARSACAQTFGMYIWALGVPAVAFNVAGLFAVSDIFLSLAGICFVWSLACLISGLKPQREYRRAQYRCFAPDIGCTRPMKQAIREELLNRGLTDMLQLVEMASVTKDHLDGSVGKDDLVQTTTEVIRGLLGLGYAVFGDVIEDEGLLCVRPWELSLEDTIERIKDEWRALGGLRNLGEVGWLELTESGREEATRSPA